MSYEAMAQRPASGHAHDHKASGVSGMALVGAELRRAARTRSTAVFMSIAMAATLAIFSVRVLASRGDDGASVALIILSADVIGFIVIFSSALSVARDHQSGSIDLVRVLVPTRGRQALALASAHALLGIGVVLIITIVGVVVLVVAQPSALNVGALADGLGRLTLTTVSLAFAGAGVGAICRSSVAATCVVLVLYLLLPIALIVAGFVGQSLAGELADSTLGLLASTAISNSPTAWTAAGGVVLWSVVVTIAGMLRETTVR